MRSRGRRRRCRKLKNLTKWPDSDEAFNSRVRRHLRPGELGNVRREVNWNGEVISKVLTAAETSPEERRQQLRSVARAGGDVMEAVVVRKEHRSSVGER